MTSATRRALLVSTLAAGFAFSAAAFADTPPSPPDLPVTAPDTPPPAAPTIPAAPSTTEPVVPTNTPYFTITDLGPADQVAADVMPGLNAKGDVTVWRLQDAGYRPVLVSTGTADAVLDTPAGYFNEFAYSLNDNGDAAGWANTTKNPVDSLSTTHAFFFSKGKSVDLGTLGGKDSQAYAVNNGGVVVGVSQTNVPRQQRAFRYADGKLDTLDPLSGGDFSIAFAVNEAGVAVGGASMSVKGSDIQPVHAALWRGKKPQDLGTLTPGRGSEAYAINNHNDVVGVADTPTGQTVFLYSQGHMTDLDIDDGRAYSINDNRQAVGTHEGTERGYDVGWYWDNGTTYTLNDCIDKTAGYWIESGDKINDAGQIICTGRLAHRVHFLLLTPAKRP